MAEIGTPEKRRVIVPDEVPERKLPATEPPPKAPVRSPEKEPA
jgi:hypothetical protein